MFTVRPYNEIKKLKLSHRQNIMVLILCSDQFFLILNKKAFEVFSTALITITKLEFSFKIVKQELFQQ